jgi:hypothetical protein
MADGLGMGTGPRAVLVTRAVAEASRLGLAAGAEARTFAGLAGLGNLLVRASGDRSPDYLLGRRLADGVVTADSARTEGARAALAGVELAKSLRVRMPVLQGIAAVLSELELRTRRRWSRHRRGSEVRAAAQGCGSWPAWTPAAAEAGRFDRESCRGHVDRRVRDGRHHVRRRRRSPVDRNHG